MTAWAVFAALAALAGAALARAAWRGGAAAPAARGAYDIAVFRRQLGELEADAARGLIDAEEARAARIEIERRILAAGADAADSAGERGGGRVGAVLISAIGVPLAALAIYAALGSPGAPDAPLAARQPPDAPAEVERAIAGLAERLRRAPGDLDGWVLLGRSYMATGRYGAAAEALSRAAALAPDDADLAASWGEALVHAAGGTVAPDAARRFDAALAIDPAHPAARYYLALAAAQAGDSRAAFDAWTALAGDAAPDAPWLPDLRLRLRELAGELGVDPPAIAAAATAEEIAGLPPEERAAAIDGMVAGLEARLRDEPGDAAGWKRLGRAKSVLGDLPAARNAWRRAVALAPDDAGALLALAGAELALAPQDAPAPEAALALYRRVLALSPDEPEALWILGLAAAEAGRGAEAGEFWGRLVELLPPDSDERRVLADRLAALRGGTQPKDPGRD